MAALECLITLYYLLITLAYFYYLLTRPRRTTQPRAWISGVNPITQRSNTPQSNGAGPRPSNKSYSQHTNQSENGGQDRQMIALHNSMVSHSGSPFLFCVLRLLALGFSL